MAMPVSVRSYQLDDFGGKLAVRRRKPGMALNQSDIGEASFSALHQSRVLSPRPYPTLA
jgi:hypothetical protein